MRTRRILALLLAVMMIAALSPAEEKAGFRPAARAVSQSDIDSLKGDAQELASQRSELNSELAELKDQRYSALQQKQVLDQKISVTNLEIRNTEKQISGYDAMLAQTDYELEENRREEEEQYALFCERARVMEKAGTTSYWAVLFKAESFSDLLGRLADIQEVIDYDQGVLDGLRQLRSRIQVKQDEQEELKAQSEEAKAALEAQKEDLSQQLAEADALYQEIQADVEVYAEKLAEIDAERERLEQEIVKKTTELARQLAMTSSVGGYIWPETVSVRITSPMGTRNTGIKGASTNHKGVDIGGVGTSTSVLATKAGIVATSAYSKSYGNYVVILHGEGNTTLYAHMSSRLVKEGDTVTQGQVIGITGSTGISSGPHLHYEITENGSRVNPLDYLPGWVQAW